MFRDADWAVLLGAVPRATGGGPSIAMSALCRPSAKGSCKLCFHLTHYVQHAGTERAHLLDINGQIYQEQVRRQDCSAAMLAMQQAVYHVTITQEVPCPD